MNTHSSTLAWRIQWTEENGKSPKGCKELDITEWLSTHTQAAAAAAAKSLQSCPTLCDPIDGSPPGSPVPGILRTRTLEWVAISSSNAWKWKVKVKLFSRVRLLATPWTAAYQAPLSMGFSRQEYWSGVPLPSPTHKLGRNKSLMTSWEDIKDSSTQNWDISFQRSQYTSLLKKEKYNLKLWIIITSRIHTSLLFSLFSSVIYSQNYMLYFEISKISVNNSLIFWHVNWTIL